MKGIRPGHSFEILLDGTKKTKIRSFSRNIDEKSQSKAGSLREMICPVSAYKYYIRANRIFRGNVQFCDAGFWIFVKPPQYSGHPDFSWE